MFMSVDKQWHEHCSLPRGAVREERNPKRRRSHAPKATPLPMSAHHIVVAALLLALPLSLKYFLALETRTLVARVRRGERQLTALHSRLEAVDRERDVVHAALLQVHHQQRWSKTRRQLIAEELQRLRQGRPSRSRVAVEADPEPAPEATAAAAG